MSITPNNLSRNSECLFVTNLGKPDRDKVKVMEKYEAYRGCNAFVKFLSQVYITDLHPGITLPVPSKIIQKVMGSRPSQHLLVSFCVGDIHF